VQGLVAHLEGQGLGEAVRSWVGPGSNIPLTPDQVHEAFRNSTILALAARAGLRPHQLAQRLAQVLPQAIGRLTHGGSAVQLLEEKRG